MPRRSRRSSSSRELKARAEAQLGPWNELLAKELPALNELMQREGVPAVGPAPVKP